MANCVNSSPPLISRKIQGFGGIWANSGNFGKIESPLTPPFLRGGFCFGVFAYFFALNIGKNTPNKKRGLRKRGFVDSRESTNPPFFKRGFLFLVFCLFFALNIGKSTPNKKRGLRKRGFVDSRENSGGNSVGC